MCVCAVPPDALERRSRKFTAFKTPSVNACLPRLSSCAQHRHLLCVPSVGAGSRDWCAPALSPAPLCCLLTRKPRAQSSSLPRVVRLASFSSALSSKTCPLKYQSPFPCCKSHTRLPYARFVNLAGGNDKICEYNQVRRYFGPTGRFARAHFSVPCCGAQEACRLNAFDGKKSLIRSFPCATPCVPCATMRHNSDLCRLCLAVQKSGFVPLRLEPVLGLGGGGGGGGGARRRVVVGGESSSGVT